MRGAKPRGDLIEGLEALVRIDPAGRGLIASEAHRGVLCPGHLAGAAVSLAAVPTPVAILTGFFIPHGTPPAPETDGPPGAVTLARVLRDMGREVVLVTDEPCAGGLAVTAAAGGVGDLEIATVPLDDAPAWCADFLARRQNGDGLGHLVAIERVGPSHSDVSLASQPRESVVPLEDFQDRVPRDSWGCCHNMRATVIDAWTADVSILFDRLGDFCPEAVSIGIGDGGNEIGMGAVAWEELVARLPGDHSVRIPCRIATDWNLLAGISNWGAWALSAAVAASCGRNDVVGPLTETWQHKLVSEMVSSGQGVDGPSGEAVVGVDGLTIADYLAPWSGIRSLLGL